MERLHVSIMDSTSKLQNGGATVSSTSDGYRDDIEAEANSYFHQMFSGQLTIDAMVQMLARFKESSVKREQLIFECMIANLFEEYRFSFFNLKMVFVVEMIFGNSDWVDNLRLTAGISMSVRSEFVAAGNYYTPILVAIAGATFYWLLLEAGECWNCVQEQCEFFFSLSTESLTRQLDTS